MQEPWRQVVIWSVSAPIHRQVRQECRGESLRNKLAQQKSFYNTAAHAANGEHRATYPFLVYLATCSPPVWRQIHSARPLPYTALV